MVAEQKVKRKTTAVKGIAIDEEVVVTATLRPFNQTTEAGVCDEVSEVFALKFESQYLTSNVP